VVVVGRKLNNDEVQLLREMTLDTCGHILGANTRDTGIEHLVLAERKGGVKPFQQELRVGVSRRLASLTSSNAATNSPYSYPGA
jgi:hypothetical protein